MNLRVLHPYCRQSSFLWKFGAKLSLMQLHCWCWCWCQRFGCVMQISGGPQWPLQAVTRRRPHRSDHLMFFSTLTYYISLFLIIERICNHSLIHTIIAEPPLKHTFIERILKAFPFLSLKCLEDLLKSALLSASGVWFLALKSIS